MVEQFGYLGQLEQIKITFTKKLRTDCNRGMCVIIRCRIFLSPILLFKNIKTKIYRTKFGLFFFLYGCQESSLTPREEQRLSLLENNVLRKIFGLKGDEVIGK